MRRVPGFFVAAVVLGCSPPQTVVTDTSRRERARPVASPAAPARRAVAAPRCPQRMRGQRSLAAALGPSLRPGAWHPDAAPQTLGLGGGWRVTGEAGAAPEDAIEAVTAFTPNVAAVALLRRQERGMCVINAWAEYFPGNVQDVRITERRTAGERQLAVIRVTLRDAGPLWIALGTDGDIAWFALEERGAHQLPVRQVSLSETGGRLYLDVTHRRTTRFALRDDGRFHRVAP